MIQSSEALQIPKDLTDSSGISTANPHHSCGFEIFHCQATWLSNASLVSNFPSQCYAVDSAWVGNEASMRSCNEQHWKWKIKNWNLLALENFCMKTIISLFLSGKLMPTETWMNIILFFCNLLHLLFLCFTLLIRYHCQWHLRMF